MVFVVIVVWLVCFGIFALFWFSFGWVFLVDWLVGFFNANATFSSPSCPTRQETASRFSKYKFKKKKERKEIKSICQRGLVGWLICFYAQLYNFLA